MSKYWNVYGTSDADFGERSCLANACKDRGWPEDLLVRFSANLEKGYSFIFLEQGSVEEIEFLGVLKQRNLAYASRPLGKFNPKDIASFEFYQFGDREISYGFEGGEIYERQRPCGMPPSSGSINEFAGCGEGKRQIRKLRVLNPKKVRKVDIFSIFTMPVQPARRVYGITRRFRDVLLGSGMKGFQLVPILDGSRSWSECELAYDYVDADQIDHAQWFQLTVMAEMQPVPVRELYHDKVCNICGAHCGRDQPALEWSELRREWFDEADIQICDKRLLPTGEVVYNRFIPLVVVSARLVNILIDNKITGVCTGKGRWGKYRPIILAEGG